MNKINIILGITLVLVVIISFFLPIQNDNINENRVGNIEKMGKIDYEMESLIEREMVMRNVFSTDSESVNHGPCMIVDGKIMLKTTLFDYSDNIISKNEYRFESDFDEKCFEGKWITWGDPSDETEKYYLDCNEAEKSKNNCNL